ncbi:MAG: aminoglycoside phosphotransferase family protein [Deltaproteobacteria bacterium]|nr:aminoglycoside phosphotransferase family protein [Deltaproteobacteria bacterium]
MSNLERDLVFYLLHRGFLTYESLVDGSVTVAADRTRHHTFAVLQRSGCDYFVKQSAGHPDAAATLMREATCYRLAREGEALPALGGLLPDLLLYDEQRNVLVLELLPKAENAAVFHRRVGRCPELVGRLLGEALGRYHNTEAESHGDSFPEEIFPRQLPWILSFDLDGDRNPYGLSPANQQLLQRVREEPAMVSGLERLRQEWQVETLIHGDMKWENCVVHLDPTEPENLCLKVVDWEAATLGDPRWDVGSLLQSYLSSLVLSPTTDKTPADLREAWGQRRGIRPAVEALWNRYRKVRKREESPGDADLVFAFAAARLLLSAFELQVFAQQPLLQAGLLINLSKEIFSDLEGTRHELFAA